MSFIRTLSTVAMIVAVGLATTASASPPTAPVAVRVHLDGDTAEVTVTFLASATDLAVQVYGVDGVRVDAPRDWPRSADAGTALVRTARLTRPRAESNLVVIVDGRFAGVRRVAVRSATLPARAPRPPPPIRRDGRGERIHPLPARRH